MRQYANAIVSVLVFGILFAGCSRDKGGNSFDGIFNDLSRAKNFSEIGKYYTRGTIGVIERAEKDGIISSGEKMYVLPLFNEKTTWDEIQKSVSGDRGEIRLRYTDHPVENMVGFEMTFKLLKEGGSWRIDLEDEVANAIEGRKGEKARRYLDSIRNGN